MNKTLHKLSQVALVVISATFLMSFSMSPGNGEIKLTPQELNKMSIEKLIQADSEYPLESCVITVEIENNIQNFTITDMSMPNELKAYFKNIKPGKKIMVQTRLAKVGSSTKKLPALVYAIVDKH